MGAAGGGHVRAQCVMATAIYGALAPMPAVDRGQLSAARSCEDMGKLHLILFDEQRTPVSFYALTYSAD